nr:hypothetical protein Iba_chr03bCG11590 [Ipomoea batatas]
MEANRIGNLLVNVFKGTEKTGERSVSDLEVRAAALKRRSSGPWPFLHNLSSLRHPGRGSGGGKGSKSPAMHRVSLGEILS